MIEDLAGSELDREVYRHEERRWKVFEEALEKAWQEYQDGLACDPYERGLLPPRPSEFVRDYAYEENEWRPSMNWEQGGPLIEREKIRISPDVDGGGWVAAGPDGNTWRGPTPLIAAMRCFVGGCDPLCDPETGDMCNPS